MTTSVPISSRTPSCTTGRIGIATAMRAIADRVASGCRITSSIGSPLSSITRAAPPAGDASDVVSSSTLSSEERSETADCDSASSRPSCASTAT